MPQLVLSLLMEGEDKLEKIFDYKVDKCYGRRMNAIFNEE